jgi:hypothetical protein
MGVSPLFFYSSTHTHQGPHDYLDLEVVGWVSLVESLAQKLVQVCSDGDVARLRGLNNIQHHGARQYYKRSVQKDFA